MFFFIFFSNNLKCYLTRAPSSIGNRCDFNLMIMLVFFYLLHANAFLKPRFFHLKTINLSTNFVSINSNPARCSIIRVYFFSSTEFFFIGFQCMWSFDCCHLKLLAIGVYALYSTAPWCSMSTLYKAIHFIVNWIEESYANSSKQQPMNVFFFWCLFFFLMFFFLFSL